MSQARLLIATVLLTLGCASSAIVVAPAAAHTVGHRSPRHLCGSQLPHANHGNGNCRVSSRTPTPHRGVKHQRTASGRPKSRVRTPIVHPVRTVPVRPVRVAPKPTRAVSQAATIANVLAIACQNTELVPEAANLALVRAAVLCLINRERAQHGESPLTPDARLEAAAEEHTQELISQNYFAHVAPDGTTPVDRIRRAGYISSPSAGYVIGENLAWGTLNLATPQSIVTAWIASPGHLANILEAQYKDTGIGVTPAVPASLSGGQPGASYAQEFGVIVN